MPRRIQRKPIRRIPDSALKENSTSTKISVQTLITILGGVTGLIVAILWLAGRYYRSGFLGEMNIPWELTSYSIWEYAESSWSRVIMLLLGEIASPLLLIAVLFITVHLLFRISTAMFSKQLQSNSIDNFVQALKRVKSSLSYLLVIVIAMYFVYAFSTVLVEINKIGHRDGRYVMLAASYPVDVYSKESLPLGVPQVVLNSSPPLNHYGNLRFLTYNNGKYYLFRDMDPSTCKPAQVFIIHDSPNTYFVLGKFSSIENPCNITPTMPSTPTAVATPIP